MICTIALASCCLSDITVGPGKDFATIQEAVTAANWGETIEVFPSPGNYAQENVLVTKRVNFVGMGAKPVLINGKGFDYNGANSTARALFEFDPGSDGSTIRNFDLGGASNDTFSAAGILINQANNIKIVECSVHNNDNGIVSNGTVGSGSAANQVIANSFIGLNGNAKNPTGTYNLLLGGTGVTVQFCDISKSLFGANIKSSAHWTQIQYNFIQNASGREVDFTSSWDTDRACSNALLLGNVIVKSPTATNQEVIHYGQEGGTREGTLFMNNNTVVTPFKAPVLDFDSPTASMSLFDNAIVNMVQSSSPFVVFNGGTNDMQVGGSSNWLSRGYVVPATLRTDAYTGGTVNTSPFIGASYQLNVRVQNNIPRPARFVDGDGWTRNSEPMFRYEGTKGWRPSATKFLGAG